MLRSLFNRLSGRRNTPAPQADPPQGCYTICYRSEATRPFSEDEMNSLLLGARMRNVSAGIGGLLIHNRFRFWQILEGPQDYVEAAFARISRDHRHDNVVTIERGPRNARKFPDFEMGELDISTMPEDDPLRCDFEALFNGTTDSDKAEAAERLTRFFKWRKG